MPQLRRFASRTIHISLFQKAEEIFQSFSASGRALFLVFAGIAITSSLSLLFMLNSALLVTVPAHGGSLSEGIIGTPRFINPILALSDADRDLASLIYSGLLRATPEGDYIPDLAEEYTISGDGRIYTFTIRANAVFQDGTPVTADDIIYTVQKTQDTALKSPVRANWDGVGMRKVDARTVEFTLKGPYAPFIQNLTLGILPHHLWQPISTEEYPFTDLNTSPIGSGPYTLEKITRTSSGIPSSYTLVANKHYALGEPYISKLTFRFYQSEEALVTGLKTGEVEAGSGVSPADLSELKNFHIEKTPLNRVFGVFFNQNQSQVLREAGVRKALSDAIDRQALVTQVLGGYGTPLSEPVPPNLFNRTTSTPTTTITDRTLSAQQALTRAGWTRNADGIFEKTTGKGKDARTTTLSFTLSTGNVPELRAAAEYLRATWRGVGADVTVQIFDQGDLSQNVIRPRRYDALLFGEVIGRELDLFAFWHSSQRNDPGLNIALYANTTADTLLEKLRQTSSESERTIIYQKFLTELNLDTPAVFLYSPDFVYSVPKDIQGMYLGFVEKPSDRFLGVTDWHRETDHVWPIFVPKEQ